MKKLYEEKGVLFAVAWILAYCLVMTPIKGEFGYGSVWMMCAMLAFAAAVTAFVKANRLEARCGLASWPRNAKRYLWFLPMFLLATGNLWDGFALSYRGAALVFGTLSMLLVGYVEEVLFRGFLFRALLQKDGPVPAIIISALTFGIGHIVNLFAGQASLETAAQVIFAVAWGFLLTMAYYKSGSLLPGIAAHALIDACSLYGADSGTWDWIYIGATIATSLVYCLYLGRLKAPEKEN